MGRVRFVAEVAGGGRTGGVLPKHDGIDGRRRIHHVSRKGGEGRLPEGYEYQ